MDRIQKGVGSKLFGDPNSVVDYLKGQGQDASMQKRAEMASSYGIANYTGTADQNTQLLTALKSGAPKADKVSAVQTGTQNSTPAIEDQISSAKIAISEKNATYGKDPKLDSILASQYINPNDAVNATYIDKVGMETGMYADIQNIDKQVLSMYKVLGMPNNDIFSDPNLSNAEKIAMTQQRRDITFNRITQLRRLQQGKIDEMKSLAEAEQKKAEAQEKARKEALDYLRLQMDQQKLTLDEKRFGLEVYKAENSANMDANKYNLDLAQYGLERDKFTANSSGAGSTLPEGNYSTLGVGGTYGNWKVSQTYGTNSVLGMDNVKLANGQVGTPGIDLVGKQGDPINAFSGGTVVKVVSGQSNVSVADINAGRAKASYGNQVVVRDNGGNLHYYNHLDNVGNFKEGQAIQQGQVIGTMGNSGSATGVHLDYRVQGKNGWEDPRAFMTNEKKGQEDITNLDQFLNKRESTPGGNVASKVKPKFATDIIKEDIGKFSLSNDEFNDLKKMPGVDQKVITTYGMEKFYTSTQKYTSDQFKDYLSGVLANNKDEANRKAILQMAVYSGKLDDDLFKLGIFNDGAGYDMLQEYFDDPASMISEMKKNMTSLGYTPKTKPIVNPMKGPYDNVYQNYYYNMYQK